MTIEAAMRAHLIADPGVSGLVGQRIYPIAMPQGTTLPAITYQRVSTVRIGSKQGPTGMAQPRLQINCWSKSYGDAKALADAVRVALDGYRGLMGGAVDVWETVVGTDVDLYEEDLGIYHVAVDVTIWHRE